VTLNLWLLAQAPVLAFAGMSAALYGRLGLRRAGGTYQGSPLAWMGYYGGILTVLAAAALAVVAVWRIVA
jgi:hypothetical protein